MPTPTFIDGAEHGVATLVTSGGGLADLVTGAVSTVSSTVRTGTYAYQAAPAGAAANLGWNFSTSDRLVVSLYVRFNTLPSANCKVAYLRVSAGSILNVRYVQATSVFRVSWGTSTGQQDSSVTVSANTWYRIDLDMLVNAATRTCDWQVDGTAHTRSDSTEAASTASGWRIGTDTTDTYTAFYDDIVCSTTSADYPLGAHIVEGVVPTADGTHNAGTNIIEDNAGVDIGVTTAWDKIDDAPLSSFTTYLQQLANGSTNYAEVNFGNPALSHSAVWGAMAQISYTSATTTANNAGCIVSKDSFSTSTTVHGSASTPADYSDGSTGAPFYKRAIVAGVTDDTTANALQLRFGYSTDAAPDPYLGKAKIQIAMVASAASTHIGARPYGVAGERQQAQLIVQ
jgi:hypothetical protein